MKDKDDFHGVKPCRRIYTVTAILAAIVYTMGVVTSPLLREGETKQATALIQGRPNSQQLTDYLTLSGQRCADPVPSNLVRRKILDGLFNGTSPFDGFPPEHARPLLRPKRIKGWGSTGLVFERLISEVKPQTILELGTFLGASAIHMAVLTKKLRLKTEILCVDDFRGWPGFRQKFKYVELVNGDVTLLYQFMQNVAFMNLTESVLPLPFSTVSMVRKLCEWGIFADLIEVDAAHDFLSAWADINAAYALLRPGGVIFGHDFHTKYDNSGVRRAVISFAKMTKLRVEGDGEHWILRAA